MKERVYISEFEFAKNVSETNGVYKDDCSKITNIAWAAPECLRERIWTSKSDVVRSGHM